MRPNLEAIETLGKCIRNLGLREVPLKPPYLPFGMDLKTLANYLVFMVSIDHRAGPSFKEVIEGESYRGSDLLWKLGELRWRAEPSFFKADEMVKIDLETVASWLTTPLSGIRIRGLGRGPTS